MEQPFKKGDLVKLTGTGHEIEVSNIQKREDGGWIISGEEIKSQVGMMTRHENLEYIAVEQIQLLGTWEL